VTTGSVDGVGSVVVAAADVVAAVVFGTVLVVATVVLVVAGVPVGDGSPVLSSPAHDAAVRAIASTARRAPSRDRRPSRQETVMGSRYRIP
jgi:hypothetical protein